MRKRPIVLAELIGAQNHCIVDPLNGVTAHVTCKLLIAKHGQTFFQTKLEPIAASDPVTCPIVKILMRNDGFNPFEICISRSFGGCKDSGGVKDVQPFVFHRTCVEIIDGDDVEQIKIVFAAIDIFVPFHGLLQRVHAKGTFGFVPAGANPDVQVDMAT